MATLNVQNEVDDQTIPDIVRYRRNEMGKGVGPPKPPRSLNSVTSRSDPNRSIEETDVSISSTEHGEDTHNTGISLKIEMKNESKIELINLLMIISI